MHKESLIAIVLGVVFGIGVALGTIYLLTSRQDKPIGSVKDMTDEELATPAAQLTTVPVSATPLTIVEPANGAQINAKTVKIKGSTAKGSLVLIQSAVRSVPIKAEDGKFDTDFPLAAGENVITVYAYEKLDSPAQMKELFIYSF